MKAPNTKMVRGRKDGKRKKRYVTKAKVCAIMLCLLLVGCAFRSANQRQETADAAALQVRALAAPVSAIANTVQPGAGVIANYSIVVLAIAVKMIILLWPVKEGE
jgi:hypothetical protein